MKFVFFGSIPTATECLKRLVSTLGRDNLFVVTDKKYSTSEGITVYEYAQKNKIKLIDFDDLKSLKCKFAYGFSVRFNKIFTKEVIAKFNEGIINFHGGPLPKYRGSACHIHAILNEEKEFGPTFHFIDEGIDTGPIIASRLFEVNEEDTGYNLFQKTLNVGVELFDDLLEKIKDGQHLNAQPQDLRAGITYRIFDLDQYQSVSLFTIEEEELIKRIRAFHHPLKTGVIAKVAGKKVELKLSE